jgi:hypothetical protein
MSSKDGARTRMNILDVVIGIVRGRARDAQRTPSLRRRSAAQTAPSPDYQQEVATPAKLGDAVQAFLYGLDGPAGAVAGERAAEDGYNAAWMRRKARDGAEVLDHLSEDALRQARAERREAQRLVADAAEQVQAILGRMAAGRSK